MIKVILRAALEIVFFTVTIPIRLILVIYLVRHSMRCAKRYGGSFMEWWGYVVKEMKEALKKEINWIKTGSIDLEEES